MDHLAQERADLLRTLKAREVRLMFDWLIDQSYAITASLKRSMDP